MNNRPIGQDYEDDQEDVLTPNHLVFGRRLETSNDVNDIPLVGYADNNQLIKRKKIIDTMLNHFWQRWQKEYLTSLRESQKTPKKRNSAKITIGDVVIIYDEKQPRHLWRMGKVNRLIKGGDGFVRGAEIKTGKTGAIIRRPVNKLYPLVTRICESNNDETFVKNSKCSKRNVALPSVHEDDNNEILGKRSQRPKRNAAVTGELRRKFATEYELRQSSRGNVK